MKLLRLTLAAAALAAGLAACDATRLTAPAGANPPAAAHPSPPPLPSADQMLGSGG
ncbi:MAG TPA: hypothetical protein VM890_16615 [Longimicrobium sp.]|jgi:hypothetical protein|nr:hypothetical protein [Longimicrobium sp.]